jgi:hypothetical protein
VQLPVCTVVTLSLHLASLARCLASTNFSRLAFGGASIGKPTYDSRMDGGGDTWCRVGQRQAAVGAAPWNFGADPARGPARRIPWLSSRRRDTASVYGSSRNDRNATPVGFTKKETDVVASEETFQDSDYDDDEGGCGEVVELVKMRVRACSTLSATLLSRHPPPLPSSSTGPPTKNPQTVTCEVVVAAVAGACIRVAVEICV